MTKDEALKLALEALENSVDLVQHEYEDAVHLYSNYPTRAGKISGLLALLRAHEDSITAIKEALAQPALCKYGNEVQGCTSSPMDCQCCFDSLDDLDEELEQDGKCDRCVDGCAACDVRKQPAQETKIGCVQHDCDECKARLAQPAQEPVEWLTGCPECGMDSGCDCDSGTYNPPQRPWVGLTDEDIRKLAKENIFVLNAIIATNDKLKEKNA